MPRPLLEFLADKPPAIESYIEPRVLVKQGRLFIFAEAGIGKSLLVHNLAFSIAMGTAWVGLEVPRAARVLYWAAEGSPDFFWEHTFMLDQHYHCSVSPQAQNLWLEHDMDTRLNTVGGARKALEVFKAAEPEVIILDPLYKLMRGSETDQETAKATVDFLDGVIQTLGCSIVLVHHSRKRIVTTDGRVVNQGKAEARGHTTLTQDWPDTEVQVRRTKDGLQLTFEKCRWGVEPEDILVRLDPKSLVVATGRTLEAEIKAALSAGPMAKQRLQEVIKATMGTSRSTFEREMQRLRQEGVVRVGQSALLRGNEVEVRLA